MKRPNPPRPSSSEGQLRQQPLKPRRTPAVDLGNVFRKTGEFVGTHKWQVIAGAAIALTLGGGLARWGAEVQHTADVKAAHQALEDFKADIDAEAIKIANPEDVIPGSVIHDPGNHLYDEALAFAKANGLDYQENGINTLLQSAVAISKANYIHPGSNFAVSEVDVDNNGDTEPIVQLAPEDLETLSQ